MYGTVGHFPIKPGMEGQFRQLIEGQMHAFEAGLVPGFVATYIYRTDADTNDFYLAVVFESQEAYWANAQSPEQDARYRQWLPLLTSEPEWHDGEIVDVYALQKPAQNGKAVHFRFKPAKKGTCSHGYQDIYHRDEWPPQMVAPAHPGRSQPRTVGLSHPLDR